MDEGFITYSVVVPFFNEQENLPPLYVRLTEVLDSIGEPYELIFVDDGSRDDTYKVLLDIYDHDRRVNVLRLRRNFGRAAALQAGLDFARGLVTITMDGGLRNHPEEIPLFLEKLDEGYDLVSGCRLPSKRDHWWRRLRRRMANGLMARLSGVPLHDFGTVFRACRREFFESQPFGASDRFLPVLAKSTGARIGEVHIQETASKHGEGCDEFVQVARAILGLVAVRFLLNPSRWPLYLLGLTGLAASAAGILICTLLMVDKFLWDIFATEQHGVLLLLGVALFLGGLQFLSMSMLGELFARGAGELQAKPVYALREVKSRRREAGDSAESARPSGSSER